MNIKYYSNIIRLLITTLMTAVMFVGVTYAAKDKTDADCIKMQNNTGLDLKMQGKGITPGGYIQVCLNNDWNDLNGARSYKIPRANAPTITAGAHERLTVSVPATPQSKPQNVTSEKTLGSMLLERSQKPTFFFDKEFSFGFVKEFESDWGDVTKDVTITVDKEITVDKKGR